MGISHNPSILFLLPLNITVFFFTTARSFLSITAVQPSSHSCPIEINDALFRFGIIMAVCASAERCFDNGIVPVPSDVKSVLSGCFMVGPVIFVLFSNTSASCKRK